MLKVKSGRYGARLGREMAIWAMMTTCKEGLEEAGLKYEISSGLEGEHMRGSFHYKGEACDWAVRSVVVGDKGKIMAAKISLRLGDDFDIIWNVKKKVLHSEWQPKRSFGKLGH